MSIPFYDNINLNNNKIINIGTPENNDDVTNKQYVDTVISQLGITVNQDILNSIETANQYTDTKIQEVGLETDLKIENLHLDELVLDSLESTEATKALSANMGRVLSENLTSLSNVIETLPDGKVHYNKEEETQRAGVVIGTYDDKELRRKRIYEIIEPSNSNASTSAFVFAPDNYKITEFVKVWGFYKFDGDKYRYPIPFENNIIPSQTILGYTSEVVITSCCTNVTTSETSNNGAIEYEYDLRNVAESYKNKNVEVIIYAEYAVEPQ